MNDWIFTIFHINPKLDRLAHKAEKEAMTKALRPGRNTSEEVEAVIRKVNEKNAYLNLRVIYNEMTDSLAERERTVLSKSAAGISVCEIAAEMGLQRTSVYRVLHRALNKCARRIVALGYGVKELDEDFGSLPPISEAKLKVGLCA